MPLDQRAFGNMFVIIMSAFLENTCLTVKYRSKHEHIMVEEHQGPQIHVGRHAHKLTQHRQKCRYLYTFILNKQKMI